MQIYREPNLISGNRVNTRALDIEAVKASARFARNCLRPVFKIKHTYTWDSRADIIIVSKLTALAIEARYFNTKNVRECIA